MNQAAGIITIKNGRILMVERGKEGNRKIAIPGGKCEPGEYYVFTAIRETYEETGLVTHVANPNHYYYNDDVEGFTFAAYRGIVVAGTLTPSLEGIPFWLELSCLKNIPNILQYPEWTRQAIKFFRL